MTSEGRLLARHVIHTVGPAWRGGDLGEPRELADCYTNSLILAKEENLNSVAFPSISTGVYGCPIGATCRVASKTVKEFVEKEGWPPEVIFVMFSSHDLEACAKAAKEFG